MKRGLEIKRGGERGRESKFHRPKVVSPLKRFGRHLSSRGDNRIFGAKISVIRSSFSCVFGGGGLLHQSKRFFTLKMRLSLLACK